jgi:hypothetical protein
MASVPEFEIVIPPELFFPTSVSGKLKLPVTLISDPEMDVPKRSTELPLDAPVGVTESVPESVATVVGL